MTAVGLSNIAVGLVRGFVVSGSASRSAAATGAGGRTPLVPLIAAALILLPGLLLAVALSLVLFIAVAGRRNVAVLGRLPGTRLYADTAQHPDATTTPGVLAVQPTEACSSATSTASASPSATRSHAPLLPREPSSWTSPAATASGSPSSTHSTSCERNWPGRTSPCTWLMSGHAPNRT